MLRTIVLLLTHLTMLGAGVGLAAITTRSRRQSLDARAAALDTRETLVGVRIDQLRRGAVLGTPAVAAGRHRATAEPTPSLLTASLDQAVAMIATAKAKREQERRAFVDIMTNVAQAKRWCQATASVVAESMPVGEIPGWARRSFEPSDYQTIMGAR